MTEEDSASAEHVLGHEETEKSHNEPKVEKEMALLKLKREKRLRKTELTKIRHRMEKLCIAPKDVQLIEKEIDQLFPVLESVLEILYELCIAYLESGDVKNQQAAMKEAQSLESEIQAAIEKAPTASASHENQVTYSSSPNVSEGQLNSSSPQPSLQSGQTGQSGQSSQAEEGNSKNSPSVVFANHRLKPLKVPSFGGDKTKFEDF